jgi:cellobiose phosphorylase
MKKFWRFNRSGDLVINNVPSLLQPVIHMLANGSKYFSICDSSLRGYSGFDYTRMFGEFDVQFFPKNQGRFLWVRPPNGEPWLANSWFPGRDPGNAVSFTMGMGWVRLESENKRLGLKMTATVFVPLDEKVEVWLVNIENTKSKKQKIDFIPTVPIFGGSRAYSEYHRDVVRLYNKSVVTDHIEILPGLEWVEGKTDASDICYYMSGRTDKGKKPTRMYSDRETFLGSDFSWEKPRAIFKNLRPEVQCLGKEAVGALEFKNVEIGAGRSASFVVLNGLEFNSEDAGKMIERYNYEFSLKSLVNLNKFWDRRTSTVSVDTGNRDFDFSWNKWWCYQLSMRYWFGNTGHPQFDYGSDFSGWRDFWQDMMAATVIDPGTLEKRTLHTLEGIRIDGTNATRFFARTKEFGSDEINGLWCDHPYWTAQTVLMLANFLGDPNFLLKDGIPYFQDSYRDRGESKDEQCPKGFIDRHRTADNKVYSGTVLEHLLTQLLTMFFDVGNNNLLNQKRADWNDAVDQVKGENATFSMGLAQDMKELADFIEKHLLASGTKEIQVFDELKDLIGDSGSRIMSPLEKQDLLTRYLEKVNNRISGGRAVIHLARLIDDLRNKAGQIIANVNKLAFNGKYYSGYFFSDGKPVDGYVDKNNISMMLMPQTWSLLSGASLEIDAVKKVLDAVFETLFDKKVGALKLNYPAYTKFDKTIGRITGFAPGTKENNAIFCHANLFMVWALLRLRMPDLAYKIFSGVNPLSHSQAVLRTGPWIPEYYISSDNTNWPGRGEYPLLTASAGWTRFLLQNFFFGVRGEVEGLRIDPCFPVSEEFRSPTFEIDFRGARYKINFQNKKLLKNASVAQITVDGNKIEGNLIKPFNEGEHLVEVLLGC